MKNLFSFSVKNNFKFLFQSNSPESINSLPTKKELYETACQTSWSNFQKEHKEAHQKSLKEARNNNESEDYILSMLEADLPDEMEYFQYQTNVSLISPKNKFSWERIVKESNVINSSKLTATSNDTFTDENDFKIWNLLQTNQNINKVATYLEKKYGTLLLSDKVGIWFNKKEQKTMIYFERNGKTTEIPFSEI